MEYYDTIAFGISTILICYTYLVYPLGLLLWSRFKVEESGCDVNFEWPSVSVIMAVYNEENRIKARLDNLLSLDYPADRLQIIVVSDGSTDQTEDIVGSYAKQAGSIKLIVASERKGKASALNLGVQYAAGDILAFADARQTFDNQSLKHLVRHYRDTKVGCVTGNLILIEGDHYDAKDIGLYRHYENFIRSKEGHVGSVVGATGAIYAIRRNLYEPIPPETILDDVLIPMNVVFKGYRVVCEPQALACDPVSPSAHAEFCRKARTLAGNYQILFLKPAILNPFRNRIWWQYISHKVMRLLMPYALLSLLISSAMLWSGWFYRVVFIGQAVFYTAGLIGYLMADSPRKFRLCSFAYVFLTLNIAAVVGLYRFLTGSQKVTWDRPKA